MESNLTPILRFREYENEWKVKTFKELGSVAMCKRIFKEQTTAQGEIPFYKIGTFGKIADSYISRETYEEYKEKYIYPKVGDILLSASGTIGRTVIYDGEDAYFQDSNIIWFNAHKEPLDNSFLYQFYQVVKWSGLEGSTIKRLYNENVLSTKINLPSLYEQKKIGSFFKDLDDTIALHQQELDALKQTKQGFLQKMFPKNGETKPEFRFKEFTGKWNEEVLGNIADFSKGNGYSKGDLITEGTPILLYGQLYTNYKSIISSVSSFVSKKEKSIISTGNEVVLPASGESSEDIARASAITIPGIIIGGDLNIIRPANKIEPIFLALVLSNGKVQRELSKFAQGKSVVHLQNSEIKKVRLTFPKIEEQIKIGEFFKRLDEVIELKEQELEALKQTKKGFLQKMFV